MPLPEEYFNIISKGQEQGIYSYPGLYPDIQDEPDRELGNLFDLAGQAAWGASVGLTWGAAQLADPEWDKPWDKMNQLERVGYIAGEGLSLFAPWGPFGLMGKGSAKVAKVAGNRYIGKAAKGIDFGQKEVGTILEGATKVAKNTGQSVDKVIRGLGKDIHKAVVKETQSKVGSRWAREVSKGSIDAHHSDLLLRASIDDIVTTSLKKSGIEVSGAMAGDVKHMSDTIMKGLGEGKYVNDIAEWVERGLGSRLPEGLAKYLGMGVQDFMMMGMHGLANEAFRAADNGEEWDPASAISHSAMMAAAFPLIRKFPWGGEANISQGVKAYLSRFSKTNYDKLLKEVGPKDFRKLMKILVNGSRIDLNNTSRVMAGTWKVGGKEYGGAKLLRSIDTMPIKDLLTLSKRMNKAISQDMVKHWRTRYVPDFAGSVPRMALGVVAMNYSVFKSGAFQDMDPGELASHMMMSALMTKGRGAWGRDATRSYMAEFTPYYEALNLINVDSNTIKSRFNTYDSSKVLSTYGAAYSTDPIGQQIEKAFDEAFSEYGGPDYGGSGKEFNMKNHWKVTKFIELYKMMKRSKDPNFDPKNYIAETMSGKQLNKIVKNLDNVELADGRLIKDVGNDFPEILVQLTKGPAKKIAATYGRMLQELSEELKFPAGVGGQLASVETTTDGQTKITARKITSKEQISDLDAISQYNDIIDILSYYKYVDVRGSVSLDEIEPNKNKQQDVNERTMVIMRKTMELLDREHDGHGVFMQPNENAYLNFLGQAKTVAQKDKLYKFMQGQGDPKSEEMIMAETMDTLFGVKDREGNTRYLQDITDYIIDDTKLTDTQKETVGDNINILRLLFSLRRSKVGVARDPGLSKPLTRENIEIAGSKAMEFLKGFTENFRNNMETNGMRIFMERAFDSKGGDPRGLAIIRGLQDAGWARVVGNKLTLPDEDSLRSMAARAKWGTTEEGQKNVELLVRAAKEMSDILGDSVERKAFEYIDTMSKEVITPSLKDIIAIWKNITSETMTDLYKNVRASLTTILTGGPEGKIEGVVESKIKNIITDLKSAENYIKSGGKADVKRFEKISEQIQILLDIGAIDKTVHDTIQVDLDFAKTEIVKDGIPEAAIVETELGRVILGVEKSLRNVLAEQMGPRDYMQSTINEIINHATLGSKSMGMSKQRAFEIVENLNRRLYQMIRERQQDAVKKPLSETILEFHNTLSWNKARDILKGINLEVQKATAMNEGRAIYGEMAREVWEEGEMHDQLEHGRRTPQLLRQEYGLADPNNPNEFDPIFIDTITDPSNPNSVFEAFKIVKSNIFGRTDLNTNEKRETWSRFRERDAYMLANAILNGITRPTVKFRMGIQNEPALMEITQKAKYSKTLNDDFFRDYFLDTSGNTKEFKVLFMDDINTISIFGRNRQVSLDLLASSHSSAWIQKQIISGVRILKENRQYVLDMIGEGALNTDGTLNARAPTDPFIYLRLSPGVRILFAVNDSNKQLLNDKYDSWYKSKQNHISANMGARAREVFDGLFGHLTVDADSPTSLKLKLLLMNVDYTRSGQLNKYIKEYAGPKRPAELRKIESDLFKRGLLSDGGTTQRINRKVLQYMASHHPDMSFRPAIREFMAADGQNSRLYTGILNDENFGGVHNNFNNGSPFSIRRIVLENIERRRNNPNLSVAERHALDRHIDLLRQTGENVKLESLDNSIFDGSKFVSERLARIIFAMKGGAGQWNGAKTIIMQASGAPGDTAILGKGFLVYDPDVARHMATKGLDMMVGVSSTKGTEVGKGIYPSTHPTKAHQRTRTNIRAAEYSHPGRNLGTDPDRYINGMVDQITPTNIIPIDIESIGISFTSANTDGVHISPSLFDWQPGYMLKEGKKWIQLDRLISRIVQKNEATGQQETDLLRELYSLRENDGLIETSIQAKMVQWGATSQNPLIMADARRILRGNDYKLLSNVPMEHGEDNFLTANTRNDLSNPLFMEIFGGVGDRTSGIYNGEGGKAIHRKVMQYGGVGINPNLAYQALRDLQDVTFIGRDSDGIDITFTMADEGRIDYASPFWDSYDGRSNHVRQANAAGTIADRRLRPNEFTSDYLLPHGGRRIDGYTGRNPNSEVVVRVSELMNAVNTLVKNNALNSAEVMTLLDVTRDVDQHGVITYSGGTVTRTTDRGVVSKIKLRNAPNGDALMRYAHKYMVQLGASGNAIPKLAKDQPIFRVEKIMHGKNGLAEVNHYDLRTTLQRDLDGDHFYSYLKMPALMIKKFANDMGTIQDYPLYRKFLSNEHINMFGIQDDVAGQVSDQVGFQQYAWKLAHMRQAIGSVIASRRVLSWMELGGLEYSDRSGQFNEFLNPIILDRNNKEISLDTAEMRKLESMLVMFQNSLDVHGGFNELARADNFRAAMMNYFFYGTKPKSWDTLPDSDKSLDPHFNQGSNRSVFRDQEWGMGKNAVLQRKIFDIFQRTLKTGNVIANDTWDEAGSRPPEPYELKKIHENLIRLFTNPDNYIIRELADEIGRLNFSNDAARRAEGISLRDQMINLFYQDKINDVTSHSQRQEFIMDLAKGKIPSPSKQVFNWKLGEGSSSHIRSRKLIKETIGGSVLDGLMQNKTYHDHNVGANIADGYYKSAGKYVDHILSSISMAKAFGIDPKDAGVNINTDFDIIDSSKDYKGPNYKAGTPEHAGIVRGFLEREYRNLNDSLQYLSGERFPNTSTIDKIEYRKSNVKTAIDIIDQQIAEGMVIGKKGLQFKEWDPKKKYNAFKNRSDKDVMVYRVKRTGIKVKEGDTLFQHKIDYGQLQKVKYVRVNGNVRLEPGWTYIIDNNPIIRESVNTNEARYAHAQFQATYPNQLSSRELVPDVVDRQVLIMDTQWLKYQINNKYQKTLDGLKKDKTQQYDFWEVTHSFEQGEIRKFFEKWAPKIARHQGDGEIVAIDSLMRFLLQPNAIGGKVRTAGTEDIPYYTINRRLTNAVFKYLDANGYGDVILREFVGEIETLAAGRAYSADRRITGYKMMYRDGYDFSVYGDMAFTVRSLTNHWFASPHLEIYRIKHAGKRYGDIHITKDMMGNKIAITSEIPDKVFDRGCIF